MQKQDRFFIIIVGGVIALVAVAIVVMFTSNASEYRDDSTPEGAAHNYLLAIQKEDYNRAYGYLSHTIPDYPSTLEKFRDELGDWDYLLSRRKSLSYSIDSTEQIGSEWEVSLTGIRSSGDSVIGGDQHFERFKITLVRENDQWKVKECTNYLFFSWRWRS